MAIFLIGQGNPARPFSSVRQAESQGHTNVSRIFRFTGTAIWNDSEIPAYLYASRTHSEALASLSLGIAENRGFFALIAEPGIGKTTLLYRLLEELRDTTRTVLVSQTQCSSREFIEYILQELGVDVKGMGLVAMHGKLNEILFEELLAGKRFVLVVDEAQNLDDSVLKLCECFPISRLIMPSCCKSF